MENFSPESNFKDFEKNPKPNEWPGFSSVELNIAWLAYQQAGCNMNIYNGESFDHKPATFGEWVEQSKALLRSQNPGMFLYQVA